MFGELCVRCKGRLWCGLPKCPILENAKNIIPKIKLSSNSLSGPSPPSLFIGRFGYPHVYAGPLISEDENKLFSSTKELYGKSLDDIVSKTSVLLRASRKVNVKKVDRLVEISQEIAMSEKAIDTEIWVEKIHQGAKLDEFFHPTGPRIEPRRIDIVDNPVIPRRVDMVVEEKLKASLAVQELYKNGYEIDYLQRLMAAGVLGKNKKLVPTRWSITAVDDISSKSLLNEIRYYESIDFVEYYSEKFMGNEFHIFLIPGMWEFEMIESWMKGSIYSPGWDIGSADYEPYQGRKSYASNVTGAYYSARLAVTENLSVRKRQARALIYREITPEYRLPLGVWVIREGVRHALYKKPKRFESIDEAIKYSEIYTHLKNWYKKSKIIYNMKHQRTLDDFY